jgi:hypothetical protein
MASHLDIIGSVIIAGMIILNVAFFMVERQDSQVQSINKITQQGDLSDMTATLRHDILKAGYGCDTLKILRATEQQFIFRADLENNGELDTVAYILADANNLQKSTGSGGHLYRVVNGRKTRGADIGIVDFSFRYYRVNSNKQMVETTGLEDIRAIAVAMRVKSSMSTEDGYNYTNTEFTVTPRNLR